MRIYVTLGPFARDLLTRRIRGGEDLQRRVAQAGFDGVELHLGLLAHEHGPALFDGLDFSRVTFHSNHIEFTLASVNRYTRQAAVRQLVDEVDLAVERGVTALTFHPGVETKRLSRAQAHDAVIASLEEVFDACGSRVRSSATRLCMENMDSDEHKLCRTDREIARVLDAIPGLYLTCDLAHCAMNGWDVDRFTARFESRIAHLHVSGFRPGLSHSKVSLRESSVDLSPGLRRFTGRDLVACIENRTLGLARASRGVIRGVASPGRATVPERVAK